VTLTDLVRLALEEDIGHGDVTTDAVVDAGLAGTARVIAKQALVVSGQAAAAEVFRQIGAVYTARVADGARAERGDIIATVAGPLAALLTGERTALNFLMRLCGIATHTRTVVDAAAGLRVVDTRKTTPLHRALEKAAVRHGGAANHRFSLYDGVMIKDNHIVAAGGIAVAVAKARAHAHHLLRVEVEVETLGELVQAFAAGVDVVLLDNMDDDTLRAAVAMRNAQAPAVILEASGNMTAERIARISNIGLDFVSMGGLIHQARWADVSMRIDAHVGDVHG
jgi:nicotinate-nucleotide pyrophosphorylase (carboxylating)